MGKSVALSTGWYRKAEGNRARGPEGTLLPSHLDPPVILTLRVSWGGGWCVQDPPLPGLGWPGWSPPWSRLWLSPPQPHRGEPAASCHPLASPTPLELVHEGFFFLELCHCPLGVSGFNLSLCFLLRTPASLGLWPQPRFPGELRLGTSPKCVGCLGCAGGVLASRLSILSQQLSCAAQGCGGARSPGGGWWCGGACSPRWGGWARGCRLGLSSQYKGCPSLHWLPTRPTTWWGAWRC